MATFTILGAGMMGTAFCVPLADRGHRVHLVGTHLDRAIIESLQDRNFHPALDLEIPEGIIFHPIEELQQPGQESDWFVIGVNSLGVDWAAQQLLSLVKPGSHILFLTKRLAAQNGDLQILPEVFRSRFPPSLGKSLHLYALGGPSIAGELARRHPTSVVMASRDNGRLEELAGLLQTPFYHVHTTADLIGLEFCVVLKNFYSVGVGLAQAEGERPFAASNSPNVHNPAASIFAQSMTEMVYLAGEYSGFQETTTGLAGAGDLYVTCQGGRNSRFGRFLAMGHALEEVREERMKGETIEGYEVALAIGETLRSLMRRGRLDGKQLPLMAFLLNVMLDEKPAEIPWSQLHG
ncbi:MAG: NAD(P)H-dependent glycerol-3-phosphate dehydrogenase [Anaerolineales bacterium]